MPALPAHWRCGINLGNSLDFFHPGVKDLTTEIAWENPYTTREMIDTFACADFDILRIPVTWDVHMGPDPDWLVDPRQLVYQQF